MESWLWDKANEREIKPDRERTWGGRALNGSTIGLSRGTLASVGGTQKCVPPISSFPNFFLPSAQL